MAELKKPRRLLPGDCVAIVSLSSGMMGDSPFIHKYYLAKERMEKDYGLRVIPMPNALKGSEYLYRNPQARASDLMEAFADPKISAVFTAVGGDDTVRLLPYVDFHVLGDNPKIFAGFSDTTINHFMMNKAGLVSYYGLSVMSNWAEYVKINEYTRTAMENMLFYPTETMDILPSGFCSYDPDQVWWSEENIHISTPCYPNSGYEILQGAGKVRGQLLGGCIDVFTQIYGTSLWPSVEEWQGKLLLIETSEVNLSEDLLCWLLRNLWAQGIFDVISGIIVGKPGFKEKIDSYKKIYRQVVGFEAGKPDLPILYNVNAGHAYPIGLFGFGLEYELDCDRKTLRLLEPGVC